MGQCTSAQQEQRPNSESKPPKYLRVIARHHQNESNINGYYRNISTDYPEFNQLQDSGENCTVYIRVLNIDGHPIKPYDVHYLHSKELELRRGCCWIISTYHSLQKHVDDGYILSNDSYHNFKNYFHSNSNNKTQVVNLEHHEYDHEYGHTNIYKMLSKDFRQCDKCEISIVSVDSFSNVSFSPQYIDRIFNDLYLNRLLYFDIANWRNQTIDTLNLLKQQREHIYQFFFGKNSESRSFEDEFKALNINQKRLNELGFNEKYSDEYQKILECIKYALSILNPNDKIQEIMQNKNNYNVIIQRYVENIKPIILKEKRNKTLRELVPSDHVIIKPSNSMNAMFIDRGSNSSIIDTVDGDEEVLNMVFPYLYGDASSNAN